MGRRHVELKCDSDEDCPICLHALRGRPAMVFACGHTTHLSCFRKMKENCLRRSSPLRCPICRATVFRFRRTVCCYDLGVLVEDEEDESIAVQILRQMHNADVREVSQGVSIQRRSLRMLRAAGDS